jgi:hypothetical protein
VTSEKTSQSHFCQRLGIRNLFAEPVTLCLEPWGDELSVPPKASYVIVAEGPGGAHLQVEYGEGRISVYGWSGSTLSVFENDKLLRELKIPVPRTPPRQGPGT